MASKQNSGSIGVIVTIIIFILPVIGSLSWYLSKWDSRLGGIEETLNGKDGIKEQLRTLNAKVDLMDLKAKGSKILKTPDVEIVRAGLLRDAKFSVPYESAKNKTQGPVEPNLSMTYTVESFSEDKGVIIRVQLERINSQGTAIKTFFDRRIQIKLSPVGEPVDYAFKMVGENFETPPVHFKFVVLERSGSDNLILATALSPTPSS